MVEDDQRPEGDGRDHPDQEEEIDDQGRKGPGQLGLGHGNFPGVCLAGCADFAVGAGKPGYLIAPGEIDNRLITAEVIRATVNGSPLQRSPERASPQLLPPADKCAKNPKPHIRNPLNIKEKI